MKSKFLLLAFFPLVFFSCVSMQKGGNPGNKTNGYSLTNTTWTYTDEDGKYDITFKKGGKLATTNASDVTPNNDFWEQDGKTVYFHFNDKFSRYRGKFVTTNKIEGTGENDDDRWKFRLVRK